MTEREALKLALEALEANQPINYCMNNNGEKFPMMQEDPFRFERNIKAITAIKEALAQPAQQQDPPDGCVVVARAILRKLGIADDVIDTIARPTAQQQEPTVPNNSQEWAGMDGTTAYWLIQRHADGWADVGKMMGEWLEANKAQPEQEHVATSDTSEKRVDETAKQRHEPEPVAWISVKDALPPAVRGVSYKASMTDVVLVRHSDRPDYPITAHAVVGEGLGSGVAIPTLGASEHPEIAWYSASCNLKNPFDLKNDDYERYLPKVFGSKITHWKPIAAAREVLTQPEQEPVAWPVGWVDDGGTVFWKDKPPADGADLYTTPPQPEQSQVEETLRYEIDALEAKLAECRAQQPEPVIDKSAAIRIATALGWEPKRTWVGLTDEEIVKVLGNVREIITGNVFLHFARAIEATIRSKNP